RFEGKGSVRTAFTAFANGAAEFEGLPKEDFYWQLTEFLLKMHERGVFHRDLSAGNVLAEVHAGQARFSVIDTGRARFSRIPCPSGSGWRTSSGFAIRCPGPNAGRSLPCIWKSSACPSLACAGFHSFCTI